MMVCITRLPENVNAKVETILSVNAPNEEMREALIGMNDELSELSNTLYHIYSWYIADSILQFL